MWQPGSSANDLPLRETSSPSIAAIGPNSRATSAGGRGDSGFG